MNKFQNTSFLVKRHSKKIFEKVKIKYLSLTIPKQIVLVGIILGFSSLFFPWIINKDQELQSWNAFSALSGNIGFFLIFLFIALGFLLLSSSYKQKVKMYSGVDVTNHFVVIISGIFTAILSIIALSFTIGLGAFGQYISYGNGPVFCMISGILITVGGVLIRQDYQKNNSEIILEEMSRNREEKAKKENMELPI